MHPCAAPSHAGAVHCFLGRGKGEENLISSVISVCAQASLPCTQHPVSVAPSLSLPSLCGAITVSTFLLLCHHCLYLPCAVSSLSLPSRCCSAIAVSTFTQCSIGRGPCLGPNNGIQTAQTTVLTHLASILLFRQAHIWLGNKYTFCLHLTPDAAEHAEKWKGCMRLGCMAFRDMGLWCTTQHGT
eukprot:scaffold25604_cov20-Tisochrysis_lutea.AAC.2